MIRNGSEHRPRAIRSRRWLTCGLSGRGWVRASPRGVGPGDLAIWEPGNLATCAAVSPGFQFSRFPRAPLAAPDAPGARRASGNSIGHQYRTSANHRVRPRLCESTDSVVDHPFLHCSSGGRRFDYERSSASKLSESNVHGMCRVFLHSLGQKRTIVQSAQHKHH
jgi:hypothetical protein